MAVDQLVGSHLDMNQNQIKRVLIEVLSSDPTVTASSTGRLWYKSGDNRLSVYNGAIKRVAYMDDLMSPAAHTHSIADVTNLQATLNGKQATITGAASTVTTSDLSPNMAMLTDGSGKIAASSEVTATELGYLNGVLSPIQAQIADKIPVGQKGIANGVATLDSGGKVPSSQIPGSVDDILEAASLTALNALPAAEKMTNRLYVALDTNIIYRWSGTTFVEISSTIAVGNTTGTIGTASSEAASTASRSDHTHSVANKAITNAMIADSAVNTLQLASGAVTNAKMANGAVGRDNIMDNAVDNAKLATMGAYTVKGNITASAANVENVPISSLFTALLAQSTNLPKITRVVNAALTQSGGVCTWTIAGTSYFAGTTIADRALGGYRTASVQVYLLGTDTNTTASLVLAATSINKTTGDITITINSSSNIAAGTYMAVITD